MAFRGLAIAANRAVRAGRSKKIVRRSTGRSLGWPAVSPRTRYHDPMKTTSRSLCLTLLAGLLLVPVWAQDGKAPDGAFKKGKKGPPPIDDSVPQAPASLPGKGLAYRDFLYCGQSGQSFYVVKGGKVAWSYNQPGARGEMQEATMLSNGHVLFAWMLGIKEVGPDQKVVWSYDAPPKTEIHTARAIGKDKVLFVQNGNPAQVMLATKSTNKVEVLFTIPAGAPDNPHNQTRRAWLTDAGTMVLAHTDLNKVVEYDETGKSIWSVDAARPYSVQRLANGNTLITSFDVFIREFDRQGKVVWEFTPENMKAQGYVPGKWCVATRLKNGNTLLTNNARWSSTANEANGPVQAIEITPDKKIAWALRSWKDPAFNPSCSLQFLDEPGPQEREHFGKIK
ncbi:MAG TPA: hypothetical protein VMZ90_02640 [Vicinamibacterales bacterium]|nr:hypothetical protein [Vicinamibacterales bacterium]